MSRLIPLATAGVCLFMATTAFARPYPGISGLAATADTPETAGNNPAGIVRFRERAFQAEVMWFASESEWEGEFTGIGGEFNSKDSGDTIVPRGYYIEPLTDNLSFSFTVLGASFSDDLGEWPGRYFIAEYDSLFINAFPSLAWRINDQWSVAGSAIISYTTYEQERAVRNVFDPGFGDGTSELDADGVEYGFGASTLFQLSDRTRFGLTYQSSIEPSRDADVEYRNLGPNTELVFEQLGIFDVDLTLESTSPESMTAGVYHEFDNGHAVTFDVAWLNFSDFALSEYYFNGESLVDSGSGVQYEDIYGAAFSYTFPVAKRWMLGAGAFVTNEMLDDDERSMVLRIDQLWSVGLAAEWAWTESRSLGISVSYIGQGDGPVTTGEIPGLGALEGEFSSRDLWLLQVTMDWGGQAQ